MKKLLILEDSDSLLRIWEIFFKSQACELVTCRNLESAYEAIRAHDQIDVFLCDYTIDGETSIPFCTAARAKFPQARIELVTGYDKQDIMGDIDEGLNLNYATKPVPMSFLSSLIK